MEKNPEEKAIARFFMSQFRRHFKAGGDMEISLTSALDDTRQEKLQYGLFVEKNKAALSEMARKDGLRIKKDKQIEDIRLMSLEKNLFDKCDFSFVVSPTKNNISSATSIGNNIVEIKLGNDDCLNPSFLTELINDLKLIRNIMMKYNGKLSIHSKWKSLKWTDDRWKRAKHYN